MHRSPANHEDVPTTVEQLLAAARATLRRLIPEATQAAMRDGAHLIDIRSDDVARNVLEWRLDPACPQRDAELSRGHGMLVPVRPHQAQGPVI